MVDRRRGSRHASQDGDGPIAFAKRPPWRLATIEKLAAGDVGNVFGQRREQVAGRRTALDSMVGHDHVYDVLHAPSRHVARHAIVGRDALGLQCMPGVAAEADRGYMGEAAVLLQRLVRVMTGDAGDPSLDVTGTLTEPIGVVIGLEALSPALARLVDVDVQHVVAAGLAPPEG